jgi:hypothetical protein
MSEQSRYGELNVLPADLDIAPREVARLAEAGPLSGCVDAVDAAIAEARTLMAPRARWTEVADDEIDALFAAHSPVLSIARRGARWAFVATIGSALEARVQEHFDAARFLEGVLLDAAGSTAAEAAADRVEAACAREATSERFSPGYCGWVMASQRGLFALLEPAEIGVSLLPSFLMQPLKSVSGLVVRATSEELRVDPHACLACDAQGCTRRQAAFQAKGRSERNDRGARETPL